MMEEDGVCSIHHTGQKCLTTRVMDALFFSEAVYEKTLEAVVCNLGTKLGQICPIASFGFQKGDGQQAVLIARSGGHVVVACRGTSGAKDILQDLKYFPVRLPFAEGAAHWGFSERAQSIPIESICEILAGHEDVIFTGHSLGGAVASLLCLRVLESTNNCFQHQVQCITFGSPVFANWRLAEFINSKYKDSFVHLISQKDFVPRVIPFFSAVQKLVYAGENHLTGIRILRKALECFHWIPIGALIKTLEKSIPSLVKFVLKCVAKLLVSTEFNGSFAFAGQIWILDDCSDTECKLTLTCADDLNVWHSQLNFGFGVRLTPSMLDNHAMSSYYKGVLLALSRTLHLNEHVSSYDNCNLKILDGKTGTNLARSWSFSMAAGVTLTCHHVPGSEEEIPKICCASSECKPDDGGGMKASLQMCNGNYVDIDSNKKVIKRHGLMEHMGCCAGVVRLFLPLTWEKLCAGPSPQQMQIASKRINRIGCSKPHSLRRLNSWSSMLFKPIINSDKNKDFETSRGSSLVTCKMQSVVARNVIRSSSPKKNFRIRWLIGSLGRVVRHVQALDNLCILTIVSFFFSNLHG